jgi:hypothetical protein
MKKYKFWHRSPEGDDEDSGNGDADEPEPPIK